MRQTTNHASMRAIGSQALALLLCGALFIGCTAGASSAENEPQTAATFAMDTLVNQTVYGKTAQDAMRQVNLALAEWEERFSMFSESGDIARINAAAGAAEVEVSPETIALLRQALSLSRQSDGAFAVTIAPLTLAWGVTSDAPRVLSPEEANRLLPLVNDSAVKIRGDYVALKEPGMSIDLGGIAKGAACTMAKQIYDEYGISGAHLSIGGNVYVHGQKPDGSRFRIGFADPGRPGGAYIASFEMQDAVIAVSGGYERFFEEDGRRYIHIIDPRTGFPCESDIVSVGAICEDGAEADFWSTTLFVLGRDAALEKMRGGICAILLDGDGTLYVSESLREHFSVYPEYESTYTVTFVEGS